MKTLVTFAVEAEAKYFKKRIAPDDPVEILITGMGQRAAARALDSKDPGRYGLVVSSGFSGALSPELELFDMVFQDVTRRFAAGLASKGCKGVSMGHSDRILILREDKRRFRRFQRCQAVDMESQAILEWSKQHAIPALVVRIITDLAEEDLPLDFNKMSRADGSQSAGKFMIECASKPWVVPRLIGFGLRVNRASKKLGQFLNEFLRHQNPGSLNSKTGSCI